MIKWMIHQAKEGKTLLSYGGIRIGAHISDFLVPVILATQFPPKMFGAYSLGMMLVFFFNSSLIVSSSKPMVILGSEEFKTRGGIQQTTASRLILLLSSLMVFILCLILFKNQVAHFSGLDAHQIWLLFWVLTGYGVLNFFSSLFLTLNQRILESTFLLTNAAISLCYLLGIYLWTGLSIESVFFMFFISPVVSACFFLPKLELKKILPSAFDKQNLSKMIHFTKWMMLGGAGIYFLNWGDNIILRQFVSFEDIGIYNLGYQFFKGTLMVIAIVKLYFLPFISQQLERKEKISAYLSVKRTRLSLLGVVFLGALFFLIPKMMAVLYAPHYQKAAVVVQILVFASICALYTGFYDPIIDSLQRYRFIQLLTVAGVFFNLAMDYLLVRHMGFMGAAYATVITYFLLALAREIYFRKYCAPLL